MDAQSPDSTERAYLIHRQILQIVALVAVAAAGFFVTRAVAANNRNATFRDAETWYARGRQQMADGKLDEAIPSLRRAAVRNRYDRRYVLALAQALALSNDTEAARTALMTVREAAPDDPDVNLALARVAARRHDVTEAVRFYRNALYAPWPADASEPRRTARFELIEFLLQHDQAGRALSELLAASGDLPDEAAAHVRVAALFARAGDHAHALDQYQRALRLEPDDGAALAGAGTSAFELGNFAVARAYLRRAPPDLDDVRTTREVSELVLSNDPLASRLGAVERRRRLTADVDYVRERLTACASGRGAAPAADAIALQREVDAFRSGLSSRRALDQDDVEAGVDLVDRVERHLASACGAPTAWDRALTLIARRHAAEIR